MLFSNHLCGGALRWLARPIFLTLFFLSVALCGSVSSAHYAADSAPKESSVVPSASGPIKHALLTKPYLIFGYGMQELFSRSNTSVDPFFTELSKFHNWRIGLGLRLTSFLSIELFYSSMQRAFTPTAADQISQYSQNQEVSMLSNMLYFVSTFYTPPIDIKFGTLEFGISAGIAGIFGVDYTYAGSGPHHDSGFASFTGGVSMIFGFPRFVSLRVFTDFVILNQPLVDIPVAMNYGVAINVYLL